MEEKIYSDKYCEACGNGLIKTAAICPKCGSPTRGYAGEYSVSSISPRKKEVAVILAVFLGPWSWLYTYRQNVIKFWVGLGLVLFNSFLLLSSFAQILYGPAFFPFVSPWWAMGYSAISILWIHTVPNLVIYILSIVDNARKPAEFFSKYPNGA
jgi:hypothetical protein